MPTKIVTDPYMPRTVSNAFPNSCFKDKIRFFLSQGERCVDIRKLGFRPSLLGTSINELGKMH